MTLKYLGWVAVFGVGFVLGGCEQVSSRVVPVNNEVSFNSFGSTMSFDRELIRSGNTQEVALQLASATAHINREGNSLMVNDLVVSTANFDVDLGFGNTVTFENVTVSLTELVELKAEGDRFAGNGSFELNASILWARDAEPVPVHIEFNVPLAMQHEVRGASSRWVMSAQTDGTLFEWASILRARNFRMSLSADGPSTININPALAAQI